MAEALEMSDLDLERREPLAESAPASSGEEGGEATGAEQRYAAATRTKNSLEVSLLAAAVIAACLAGAAHVHGAVTTLLPGYWGAAVFLVLVAQQDTYRRKIPNILIGPALLLALGFQAWTAGWPGLVTGLFGAAVPFVMLFALYALKAIGAGDVKALMAVGALWGPMAILHLMVWASIAGGLMAILILIVQGELVPLLRRWGQIAYRSLRTARFHYLPPEPHRAAAGGLPFGISIGLGVSAQVLFNGGPWL